MNGDQQPAVTIEHELPGRLRIRLSHALRQPERMRRLVEEHAGVGEVRYTAISRSVLVRYEPKHISTEEIVIRIATGAVPGARQCRHSSSEAPRDTRADGFGILFGGRAHCRACLARRGTEPGRHYRFRSDCRPHHGGGGSAPRVGGISPARELRSRSAQRDLFADRNAGRQCIAGGDLHLDQHLRPASGQTAESRGRGSSRPDRPLRRFAALRGCGRPRTYTAGQDDVLRDDTDHVVPGDHGQDGGTA